jgi:glutamyl-tRNA synthetase
MSVITRFAPSPTGFLHIGGARTALYNWLYAKHTGGQFLLRIEDTDRQRSTPEAIAAILDGLTWLGLHWDGEPVFQFARAHRHAEVAQDLLARGRAYRCYCTPEALAAMREKAKAEGRPPRYDGTWRDRDPSDAPPGVKPVIRLKAPQEGEQVIADLVQGEVTVGNEQLDDMILLRSDGTPTYMLAVVVDDHDMDVTHVIRGDDHLSNAFRQRQIYEAMGWRVPAFAHIPLIHGPDGAKLSKRHGALGVEAYRDMGYLPQALRNYLLRLGWGHGDAEIISDAQAIAWFDIRNVGRNPARFDFAKLDSLNAHYLRAMDPDQLLALLIERMEKDLGRPLERTAALRVAAGLEGLRVRARTLVELAQAAQVYVVSRPIRPDAEAQKLLQQGRDALAQILPELEGVTDWTQAELERVARSRAEAAGLKLGAVAQPLRAAVTGAKVSPPIFEVMEILGREESLSRIRDCLAAAG